jgi:predicted phage-related endonuclease
MNVHSTTIERIPLADADGRVDRAAWLALRAQDVTASDVGAVCGEGMYGSAAKVWAEKRGVLPPQEQTEAMKRGIWGEAAVFEALALEHPDWVLRRAKVYFRDPAARLGATPDGAAIVPDREGTVIVQCKVIAAPVFRNDWLHDERDDIQTGEATAPLAYQLQTLTEAMLSESSAGVLAVLVVDAFKWALRLFWIERHPEAEGSIRTRVAAFWRDYLDPGIQPPLDPSRDAELVKTLFPRDNGTEIDLSADNAIPGLLDERDTLKAIVKANETRLDEIDTDIKGKMGEATYARTADGRTISWKLQHRAEYVAKATSFRVLRVGKAKAS